MTYVDEDVENLEPQCIAGGDVKWTAVMAKSLANSQNAKYRTTT